MINKVRVTIEATYKDGYATKTIDFEYDQSVPERVKNITQEVMQKAENNGHDCDC